MANNGIYYSSGNSLNFTTSGTTWLSLNSQGLLSGLNLSMSAVTANTVSQVNYIDFTTGSTNPSSVAGRLFFDSTQKALSYFDIVNNQVPIAMGQQLYTRVWNATGVQIDKGKVIAITGTSNNLPSAILARNVHEITSSRPIGLAAENIPNGSEGLVLNNGILSGITLNTFANGDALYLSDTVPGEYVSSTASISFTARTNEIGYVLQTGSTTGKIYVNINNEDSNLSLTDKERNILEGNVISGGVYEYTGMTQGTGQTINVAYARGWIVRNTYSFATLPDVTNVYYTGGTNIPLANLATADATFILINSASTLVQQTTFPTPQERRENIFLGKVVHPNRSTITSINQTVDFDVSPMAALRDLWTPLKLINQGVIVSANGVNMNINTSSGTLWGNGIGWTTNQQNPDSVTISGTSPTTFQYRSQLGPLTGGSVTTGNTTTIQPGYYDVNGVVTAVGGGSNSSTNQRVYLFPTGLVRIQLGQKVYGSLTEAVAGSQTETFVEYSLNRENGILIGILSLNKNASVGNGGLVNTSYAVFNSVSKFGEVLGGTGGLSTTTLQQAYDNSTEPEILINSTLNGVSIRNGAGGADNVTSLLQGQNTAGTTTSFIRADGAFSGTSIYGTGLSATTISATTYQNLPQSVSGGGTTNYVSKWTGSTGLGDSQIFDNGGFVGIGTNSQVYQEVLSVAGGDGGIVNNSFNFVGHSSGSIAIADANYRPWASTGNEIAIGGGQPLLNSEGSYNIAIGSSALQTNVTGNNNIAIGDSSLLTNQAGQYNVSIGSEAGTNLTSGSYNVFIGFQAGYDITTEENKLFISNSKTNNLIYGEFDNRYVGINTTTVTNALHVSASTNPVRFEGLQSSANTRYLVSNTDGVVTYRDLPTDVFVSAGTYSNGQITFTNTTGGTFNVGNIPIGGAGGQPYYINLSQTQTPYREFAPSATTAAEQTTGVTINSGVTTTISNFLTPTGYPNVTLIPAGIWTFYLHSYKANSSTTFDIFVEVYKRTTGGTETLLLSTDPTDVNSIGVASMEISDGYYSGTTLNVSDRILVKVRATNTGTASSTVTFVTEGTDHYSYGVTPFTNTSNVNSVSVSDGLSGNSSTGTISIINTDKGSSQNIFKNIQVNGATQFSAGSNSSNLNFSGINITITSAATNTLVFSAGTGGAGAVSSLTAGSGLSGNSTTGAITLINTGVTGITAGSNISINQSTGNVTISSTGGGGGASLGTVYTTANNFNFL